MLKKIGKLKNQKVKISEHSFTLKTFDRGVFFPITRTIKSGIFGLLMVNYEEGSMPIKYNSLFMDKQHPITHTHDSRREERYFCVVSSMGPNSGVRNIVSISPVPVRYSLLL